MNTPDFASNRRILIVDDNPAIHEDFRKILTFHAGRNAELEESKAFLFDEQQAVDSSNGYLIDSAYQGEEGYAMVRRSADLRTFYAMAFVDLRMPPGWDGIETIVRMWEICPDLEVVICTASSDYSWDYIHRALGRSENLLVLMKPCDKVEVLQIADSFTRRWQSGRECRIRLTEMEKIVERQHQELAAAHRKLLQLTASMPGGILDNVKLGLAAEMVDRSQSKPAPAAHGELQSSLHDLVRTAERLSQSPLSGAQQEHAKCILERGRKLLTLIGSEPNGQDRQDRH